MGGLIETRGDGRALNFGIVHRSIIGHLQISNGVESRQAKVVVIVPGPLLSVTATALASHGHRLLLRHIGGSVKVLL